MKITGISITTKKSVMLFVMFFVLRGMVAQTATDLFISEYCEYNQTVSSPQYYNHYIEIYNGTGTSVDMSKYQLWRSMNATGWNDSVGKAVAPLVLKGVLANNATYVITRPSTVSNPTSIDSYASQTWSFMNISGNDAIGLAKNDGTGTFVLIDLFGSATVDPGTTSGWPVAGVSNATMNHTLVRKPTVKSPTADWSLSAGADAASSEWSVMAQNDISNIGIHTFDNVPPVVETKADTISAFFIGNSYTYYFDMPTIVANIASSSTDKDLFLHEQSTIGGYTLKQHSTNTATLGLLKSKAYDYIVVQENSLYPAKDIATVEKETFPYAQAFDSLRRVYSPCGQTVFYMTWGRKNGEASLCPTIPADCTYQGMDSLISVRYKMMQKANDALISPVGAVKNYLRTNYPTLELYDADGSHPSAAGAYAAACTFYTTLFQKDPTKCTFDFTQYLTAEQAKIIKDAAKLIVFDSLSVWNTYHNDKCSTVKVNIVSPLKTDNLLAMQSYTTEATATTETGTISEIAFYLNGELIGTDTSTPYTISFSSAVIGNNNLIIEAKNTLGEIGVSRVDFTVKTNVVTYFDGISKKGWKLYPNPVKNELNIDIDDLTLGCANMQIIDITGNIVAENEVKSGSNIVSMNNLCSGLYSVRILNATNVIVDKFIKQ